LTRGWVRAAGVLASAGMYCLAFPPWNVSSLAWIALVPLLLALRGLAASRAAAWGFVWGTCVLSGIGYWVPGALSFYWEQPYWFGFLFALGVAVVFMGQYFAVFGAACARVGSRSSDWSRPWVIAALYVSCEFARANLLTGHPWLLLGYALVPHVALIQVAELGGVYLLSFALALTSAFVAESIGRGGARAVRPLIAAALVVASVWGYGRFRLSVPMPSAPAVPVMVVQGNVDLGSAWKKQFFYSGLREYLQLTADGAAATHPRLVVWPEAAVTFFLEKEDAYRSAIADVLRQLQDTELIVGGPHAIESDDPPRYFNSAFYLTPDGRIGGRYDKVHLLPFAEYFPLRTIEFLRRRFERVRYFTAAEEPTLLHTRFGDVATLICFEAIFPEVVRRQTAAGAALMVNLSNDGWFGPTAGAEQHLVMVALRAVESRLWIVRATTTGVSAIIDPYGRITTRTQSFTAATIGGTVVPMKVTTPYERYGDAFAWLCVLIAIAALVAPRARRPVASEAR
jgi:apolipoprotein N-acyltransferase